MTSPSSPRHIDDLWALLKERIASAGYADTYASESLFEEVVWTRIRGMADDGDIGVNIEYLTSHLERAGRSAAAWKKFCAEPKGPDVTVLRSKNRLDIVVKALNGSIGIEVKSLGAKGHCGKLTQGLGQALLALAHRDRTILVIHCGVAISDQDRAQLRIVGDTITRGTRTSLVVVP